MNCRNPHTGPGTRVEELQEQEHVQMGVSQIQRPIMDTKMVGLLFQDTHKKDSRFLEPPKSPAGMGQALACKVTLKLEHLGGPYWD